MVEEDDNLLAALYQFQREGHLCDATLISSEGKEFVAHAGVLAASSYPLAQQMSKCECGIYRIETSMSEGDILKFIDYAYRNKMEQTSSIRETRIESALLSLGQFANKGLFCNGALHIDRKIVPVQSYLFAAQHAFLAYCIRNESFMCVKLPNIILRPRHHDFIYNSLQVETFEDTTFSNRSDKPCNKKQIQTITIDDEDIDLTVQKPISIVFDSVCAHEMDSFPLINRDSPISQSSTQRLEDAGPFRDLQDDEQPGGNSKTNNTNLLRPHEKPSECSECKKIFKHQPDLKRHERTHTGLKPFKCVVCNKGFTRAEHLKRHQLIHTGGKAYICAKCGEGFDLAGSLKIHQNKHVGIEPHKCTACEKLFDLPEDLLSHQQIHTDGKPYACAVCNKGFALAGARNRHKRIHTGEKPFMCNECGKVFARLHHLQTHQRTHTGEKPFPCNLCGKAFTTPANLYAHQRIHSNTKPFICEVCHRAFTESGSLKRHQRTHTGEKPYLCDVCHRGFRCSAHLTVHRRVHTGERPYVCDICEKSFSQIATLQSHYRIHSAGFVKGAASYPF